MGLINLEERTKAAIAAVDALALRQLVDDAIRSGFASNLASLRLYDCGEYVNAELGHFEHALSALRAAKSAKKREDTMYRALKAGSDLVFALERMKERVRTEEREGERFHVSDPVLPPHSLSADMRVRVSFRWRRETEGEWKSGSIIFRHEMKPRIDYRDIRDVQPKRKPSASKLAEQRERELYDEWGHLEKLCHWAVRDYFKADLDGDDIPSQFDVRLGADGRLNNFSANFWTTG